MQLWLARDFGRTDSYMIGLRKPVLRYSSTEWSQNDDCELIRASIWERLSDVHLSPGEGPIQIRMMICIDDR